MTATTQGRRAPSRGERSGRDARPGGERRQRDDQGSDKGSGDKRNGKGSSAREARVKNSHIIEEFIDLGVPHDVAYDQWTQYDAWSKIFKKESAKKGGGRARQPGKDEKKVTITAKIGPSQRQWEAEVAKQEPGRRIEWRAKGGVQAKGVVAFHRLDDRLTRLAVIVQYRPSGFMETVGNFFRMQRRRVRKDLKLFKNFVELRGEASGKGGGQIRGQGLERDVDAQVSTVRKAAAQHGDAKKGEAPGRSEGRRRQSRGES